MVTIVLDVVEMAIDGNYYYVHDDVVDDNHYY
jgi:hypothetical protein